ncbi:hypothetical protein [Protaetiibacter mangrovi]|uniref:Uncharacterized protein n=1 Tax=Protaetiibacter mangrovi TaxID=2970926 RepID=A0ABT1ZG48_9MICO|nr:hypothetical protein [Protaetiibacter mangrovi]MCS0499683.1 hypothetical protein [Protaetiibacter mangrovi]
MIGTRHSPQQLDPLAGVTAQFFAWIFTSAAFATSVGLTILHRAEYHSPLLLAAAFLCLVATGAVVVGASAPRRAPFTRRSAIAIHVLGLAAVGFEAAAQWGTNTAVRSDWAPLALALFVMATGCFRPASEILIADILSVLVVTVVTTSGAVASDWPLPAIVYAGLTAGPLLAAGVGAAVFSATLVTRLLRWRESTGDARLAAAEQLRAQVRDELHRERLTLVEREVGPFLRELVARGETDAADAERARELGDALRAALVAESEGVWLGDLVDEIRDPDGLAVHMDETQRAAVEAACAGLADRRVTAELARVGDLIRLTLRWGGEGRGRLRPEMQAILRLVFPGARVRPTRRHVEVEFEAA